MFLIVGLGNPGPRYAHTKHNVGFWVLDLLGFSFRLQDRAWVAEAEFGSGTGSPLRGLLVKPATFYNASGEAVAPLARLHGVPPERILVVHDELDLPPGRLRFKAGGSAAGNYGVASIAQHLGSPEFHRLRIGIGKPPSPEEGADWVLSGFPLELRPLMERVVRVAAEAARTWAAEGLEVCQKRYNGLRVV
ncbi:MAG: aminoacyl-tRNA hydrolase [Meiothermus sp.]|uniref:aminoacyl-tRNA hydrolase n=1 Tax=Meiothermus sp. TaxID=1955249 RepID=UPI0025DC34C7|nr:aminoacyl-tRNA hydrolase [Meiothermus sp.]MCS7058366.1 aminoacyl-tRNA hydrolase [Meiothermus sp.]MCS7194372.1 aminoacyl-tRNA hydrolase [Meiothermus sp.]MDW8089853.1 aminoacyl-tRNA hydrolase [Meiothermus sp.]MDW8481721.1 aminoacyl-tRNA hydrolase [Meiothermus sp.]